MKQCKTYRCTRNSVPDAFGYCSLCFSKIMEVRKVKALESIAESLKLNNSLDNIQQQKEPIIKNKIIKKNKVKSSQIKSTIVETDFIPEINISSIKSTNVKVETETNNKNLKEISSKLKNIN